MPKFKWLKNIISKITPFVVGADGKIIKSEIVRNPNNFYRSVGKDAILDAKQYGVIKAPHTNKVGQIEGGPYFARQQEPFNWRKFVIEGTPESARWVSASKFNQGVIKDVLEKPLFDYYNSYQSANPNMSSQEYSNFIEDYEAFPMTNGDVNSTPAHNFTYWQKHPIIGWRKHLFEYPKVKRMHMDDPARSAPIMDLFRLQIPSWQTGSLGYGHKYRTIGNAKGLDNVIKYGIISKNPAYNAENVVYWSQNAPLREYTNNSALMVSYDKDGQYKFEKGNFGNPTSKVDDPISLFDPNVRLHGRYPFSSIYHEIPKTKEGFQHAKILGNLNAWIERPIKLGAKGALGYTLYDYFTKDSEE